MAAQVATSPVSSDPRARLRINQQAARRTRQTPLKKQSRYLSSLGSNRIRGMMAGAALSGATPNPNLLPQAPAPVTSSYSASDTADSESMAPEYSTMGMEQADPGEAYQRAFRQRQIQHQIGQSVGLLSDRQYSYNDQPSELEMLEQEYAQREADLLTNSQLGIDQRSSAAKRASQAALKESGVQEALEQLGKEFSKELTAFSLNLAGDAGEAIDVVPADFELTEAITFVRNQAMAVRTILSPAPAPLEEAQDIRELMENVKKEATNALLDAFIPRMDIHTPKGFAGLLGALGQWFIISLVAIVVGLFIALQLFIWYTIYSFVESPISTILGFLRYQIGL